MSYTHVCIETAPHLNGIEPKIKKGDYATLIDTRRSWRLIGGSGMIFKEDNILAYSAYLFLPLPPPTEKTVYVAVSEEVKKEIEEPVLN